MVIVVFTDGTCCSLEAEDYAGNSAELITDREVWPLQVSRIALDRAFGKALASRIFADATADQVAEIAEYDRKLAEQAAAKVAAMQKAAGVVPIEVANKLLTALQLVVNTTPVPGEDAVLTAASYNAACEALAHAEAVLKRE